MQMRVSPIADDRDLPRDLRPLPRRFFARDALTVAHDLIGRLLVFEASDGLCGGLIVEAEAYDETEPASHCYRGPTPRNRVMFGPPGHLYVYRSYGVHWCSNIVTGREGFGSAVLLRALEPRFGIGRMCQRRSSGDSPRELRELARGPGRLCAALAITDIHYGVDLTAPPLFVANPPGRFVRPAIRATPRIGIRQAAELEWRVCAVGNPHVSGPARLR